MELKYILAAAVWLLMVLPANATDTGLTITTPADITSKRQALINNAWGSGAGGVLPATMPTSVAACTTNPFPPPTYNINTVNGCRTFTFTWRYSYTPNGGPSGNTMTANLYTAGTPNLNRMTFLNGGHQCAPCDGLWQNFALHYNLQLVIKRLLAHGISVMAMNMPAFGDAAQHTASFAAHGATAMQDFFEPMNETINWLQANAPFADYNTMGLSGGAWTSDVYPALDMRIHISIGDAGGGPGYQFPPGAYASPNYGDCLGASGCYCEQQGAPAPNRFYDIAGFSDLYVMSAYGLATVSGRPRYHRQIMNTYDSGAYGQPQWTDASFNYQTYYSPGGGGAAQCGNQSCPWQTWLSYYSTQITNLMSTLGIGSNPPVVADPVANYHQISDCGDSSSFTVTGGSGATQSGTCIPANATAVGGYPDAISLMLAALDANPPSVIVLAGGTRGLRLGGR
jgi:hypothetical protein